MLIKQISIFVENKPGRLTFITKLLAENGINIRALSIADTKDFGILRIIVNKPDLASEVLKKNEIAMSVTNVIAAGISDTPGGLNKVMDCLYSANISVEYMYAFATKSEENSYVVLRVENNDKAIEALESGNYPILTGEQVYDK